MQTSEAVESVQSGVASLSDWTADRIHDWSGGCGRFLQWERDCLLLREPSPKERKEHKVALTWLLRLTRLLHAAVSEPDFPDRSASKELRGRLRQLQDSWQMFYENPLTEGEANKLLAELFPDEPGA